MAHLDGGTHAQSHPTLPKNNLDDAFKSLEQLLTVLQGTNSTIADHAGDARSDWSPDNHMGCPTPAATRTSSLPLSCTSTGRNDFHQSPKLKTPQAKELRRQSFNEFQELLQAAENSLYSPLHAGQEGAPKPLAWHEGSSHTEELPSAYSGRANSDQQPGDGPMVPTLREPGIPRQVGDMECQGPVVQDAEVQCQAPATHEMAVQCDTVSEPLRRQDEELCRLGALVQAGAEELSSAKRQHQAELNQLRSLLQLREEELAARSAQCCIRPGSQPSGVAELQAALTAKTEEALALATELQSVNWRLHRLQAQQEKELEDCADFLQRLAASSSTPALGLAYDLGTTEVLGMGNYGFVITCKSRTSGERVVVKLQSMRWAGVAAKEWAHGSQLSGHSHIVSYLDAIMHRDSKMEIENFLKAGFDKGILTRRRPKYFPESYFCIALEYMDRGTVQNLLDKHALPPESVGAVTRQVASALSFMHKRKRTHNDIKPENILLRQAPEGGFLVAKLADLGLASHSSDRVRDQELFAYTLLCMGLRERFERCPTSEDDRRKAVERFRQAAPVQKSQRGLWEYLTKVLSGLWAGSLEMVEVEGAQQLLGLQVALPSSRRETLDLEASAKRDVPKRASTSWRAHKWRGKERTIHKLMALHATEGLVKTADSDPEEDREGETEGDGPPMAATWPR